MRLITWFYLFFGVLSCSRGDLDTGKRLGRIDYSNSYLTSDIEDYLTRGYRYYYGESEHLVFHTFINLNTDKPVLQRIHEREYGPGAMSYVGKFAGNNSCEWQTTSKVLSKKKCREGLCVGIAEEVGRRLMNDSHDSGNCQYLPLYKGEQSLILSDDGQFATIENYYEKGQFFLTMQAMSQVNLSWRDFSAVGAPPPISNPKMAMVQKTLTVYGKNAERDQLVVGLYDVPSNTWNTIDKPLLSGELLLYALLAESKLVFYTTEHVYVFSLEEKKWLTDLSWDLQVYTDHDYIESVVSTAKGNFLLFKSERGRQKMKALLLAHDYNDSDKLQIKKINMPEVADPASVTIDQVGDQLIIWAEVDSSNSEYHLLEGERFFQLKRNEVDGIPLQKLSQGKVIDHYLYEPDDLFSISLYDTQKHERVVASRIGLGAYPKGSAFVANRSMVLWGVSKYSLRYRYGAFCHFKTKGCTYISPQNEGPLIEDQSAELWDGEKFYVWGGCVKTISVNGKERCQSYSNDGKILTVQ